MLKFRDIVEVWKSDEQAHSSMQGHFANTNRNKGTKAAAPSASKRAAEKHNEDAAEPKKASH